MTIGAHLLSVGHYGGFKKITQERGNDRVITPDGYCVETAGTVTTFLTLSGKVKSIILLPQSLPGAQGGRGEGARAKKEKNRD